jgi:hypothetical protein
MKFKINKDGILEIERAGKFKKMECTLAYVTDGLVFCSDNCPLFGEPEYYGNIIDNIHLRLCHNVLLHGTKEYCKDERVKE